MRVVVVRKFLEVISDGDNVDFVECFEVRVYFFAVFEIALHKAMGGGVELLWVHGRLAGITMITEASKAIIIKALDPKEYLPTWLGSNACTSAPTARGPRAQSLS
jgi:hypothetical protein